ncbi:MAG: hypothetical protein FJW38_23310, partial [Acidobacteria bacterium]|nr:hypothetical protein [Acidobacteriota bacterium]
DGYKNPQQVDRMVEDVARAGGNAIFIETRHRGGSYFLKSTEPPAEDATYSKGFDALEYVIAKAHERGIQVHAWAPVYPTWPLNRPPADPNHVWNRHGPNAAGEAMWATVSAQGAPGVSLDPGHPAATAYLVNVILDPLRHYDIDGIHLDYIRYPEAADFGYNPIARARFDRLSGGDARAWADFRRRQVTDLVRHTYLRAAAIKPRAIVSAALICWGNGPLNDAGFTTTDAYARVFQNWRAWLEEGILDLAMPMMYFREPANGTFLDRWLSFTKERSYRRAIMPGIGIYLNPIANSMAQANRVLATNPAGLAFYSYAVTNQEGPNGRTLEPNENFYTAAANLPGLSAPPVLAWKTSPTRGHISGQITVDGPAWLADGASISIESDDDPLRAPRLATSDGTGFFGAVDFEPGRYRVRVSRAGKEIFRSVPQELSAGSVAHFEIALTLANFDRAIPRLAGVEALSPGELVTLAGENLSGDGPIRLLVNGQTAAVLSASDSQITAIVPMAAAESYLLIARHSGLDSAPVSASHRPAAPKISGINRLDGGILEIYATGLGRLETVAGSPLARTAETIKVILERPEGVVEIDPLYSDAAPGQPGRYQVNAVLPEGWVSGKLRLSSAGVQSEPVSLE